MRAGVERAGVLASEPVGGRSRVIELPCLFNGLSNISVGKILPMFSMP